MLNKILMIISVLLIAACDNVDVSRYPEGVQNVITVLFTIMVIVQKVKEPLSNIANVPKHKKKN